MNRQQHTSCDGCTLNRAGKCRDLAVYGPRGGSLLTDPGVRHCYQVNETVLLNDLQDKVSTQEQVTNALWRRTREGLDLLYLEYSALDKDTTEVVDWLQVQLLMWQGMGDQIREDKADSDDDSE